MSLLKLTDVGMLYGGRVPALEHINLTVEKGDWLAVMGPSGSGKTTLMNIIGCLDRPSRGSYQVAGKETGQMQPDELARLRREHFGFIFQRYHLMGDQTAITNVEIPSIYAGIGSAQRHERARSLLARLAWASACTTSQGNSLAGSSSAWRWRAPW